MKVFQLAMLAAAAVLVLTNAWGLALIPLAIVVLSIALFGFAPLTPRQMDRVPVFDDSPRPTRRQVRARRSARR